MRYENKTEPRQAPKEKVVPDVRGFYWAKWQICEDGTEGYGEEQKDFSPTGMWEIVQVLPAFGVTDADLVVYPTGEDHWQSLENFIWAKPIKPLEEPHGS